MAYHKNTDNVLTSITQPLDQKHFGGIKMAAHVGRPYHYKQTCTLSLLKKYIYIGKKNNML